MRVDHALEDETLQLEGTSLHTPRGPMDFDARQFRQPDEDQKTGRPV